MLLAIFFVSELYKPIGWLCLHILNLIHPGINPGPYTCSPCKEKVLRTQAASGVTYVVGSILNVAVLKKYNRDFNSPSRTKSYTLPPNLNLQPVKHSPPTTNSHPVASELKPLIEMNPPINQANPLSAKSLNILELK